MKREEFNKLKTEFLENQLKGKEYYIKGNLFIPKSYADKKGWTEGKSIILFEEENEGNQQISKLDPFSGNDEDKVLSIKIAICRAYEDSQARLISGHENIAEDLYDFGEDYSHKYKSPLGYLMSEIIEFLKKNYDVNDPNNQSEFDNWHLGVCKEFKKKYNNLLENKLNGGNGFEEQNIGKIQKIVNMTMKYLYCMTNDNEPKFKECHMPLDHYTLENWFCRVIKGKGSPSKEKIGKWSKIKNYGEKEDGKYKEGSYMWIQSEIRGHDVGKKYCIDKDVVMTPLQAEFIIWEEEKIREVLLGVINLDVDDKKKYYDADLQDIISKACKVVKELNGEK